MSDKTIRVGDLVCVVRAWWCGCAPYLGNVFTVTGFISYKAGHPTQCPQCGLSKPMPSDSIYAERDDGKPPVGVRLLKRIDPDNLNESVTERETEKA